MKKNLFDHLKSLSGSLAGPPRVAPLPVARVSSDSNSYGSFVNLKLTAEKLVKEQASLKTDLELAQTKLKKATEHIQVLETKLQQAVNEKAKLKVKQTEDTKLWKGLDSKLSSTKTMCDQLTETLQRLADQTCAAEEDKKIFEEKLDNNLKALDQFELLFNDLSTKLENASNTINNDKQEILELRHEKEEAEKCFRNHCYATDNAMKEKDAVIKELNEIIEDKKANLQSLDSQLQERQHELSLKEDTCKSLRASIINLENENSSLERSNRNFAQEIEKSCQHLKELEISFSGLAAIMVELHNESAALEKHIYMLFSSLEVYYDMVQKQKELTCWSAQHKYDQLHEQFKHCTIENDAIKLEKQEQKDQILELQKAQEFIMVQHADECRLAEEKVRILESEIKDLLSKKNDSDKLTIEFEGKVKDLSESHAISEAQVKSLSDKISSLESENHNLLDKLQLVSLEGAKEAEALQNEISMHHQTIQSIENQLSQLKYVLNEKEQLLTSSMEREKQLEEEKSEVQALLAAAEAKLREAKRQYDLMLEGKQLELSKHLKELSQKNDQAINDIQRKYEMEKLDIVSTEKEKTEKIIKEIEKGCDVKIAENKEQAKQCLMRVKEEHGKMIIQIKQNYEEKESSLLLHHKEELKRVQLQAENEMREKTSSLRKEHEIQVKSLTLQHEDECRKLQEELELQKTKEEKQKALLQLQWKVMGENQQVDQEVNSKKNLSLSGIMRTPMVSIMKKVEDGSPQNIPNHRKKVTRHEYEIETSNGTITKRRKTKSTVMFGEPNTQKTLHTQTPITSNDVTNIRKVSGGNHPHPANIGDLFSEGSLNPYADDPYAFD
nr:PREDICTED: synaptonemal complex protein ZEP1-like isoform X2 [Musa acuminata subsp. malaccensis]